jgi:Crp-like helix-turn-helix domain
MKNGEGWLSDEELNARNRAILLMVLDLLRQTHSTFLGGPERFGRDLDILFVGMVIWLGSQENRPMTPHKLADYLGMPRNTAARKIQKLKRRGIVEDGPDNTIRIVPAVLATEPAKERKRRWIRTFQGTADILSKMDTHTIDVIEPAALTDLG